MPETSHDQAPSSEGRDPNAQRLARGIFANMVVMATRISVQFATIPIFFASWNTERVGAWMLIFALPGYLALVGNAFAGAGGTAALAAVQEGDLPRARADFFSSWLISSLTTAGFALPFIALVSLSTGIFAAQLGAVEPGELNRAMAWLALYIFAIGQLVILEIPFRAAGRYPDHLLIASLCNFAEIAVIAVTLAAGGDFGDLSMALALARCICTAIVFVIAKRILPALFAGARGAMRDSFAVLLKPSLGFMMAPLVFGLNLQGYVLLVGASFGAAVLAAFVATRTLARVLDLFSSLAFATQYYEAGYLEANWLAVQRRQLATMTLVALLISAVFALAMFAIGPWLQSLYTLDKAGFLRDAAIMVLAAGAVRALAVSPMAIMSAANRHFELVAAYLAGSALALALAVALAAAGAPLGAVLATLVLAEAAQTVPAFRAALRRLELSPAEFLASLASRERIADVTGLARLLLKRR